MWRSLATVFLLVCSNTFMTFAWYFHLAKREKPWGLLAAIGISWLIALPEYCFQVPANRLGSTEFGGGFTLPQLKIIQEAVTLAVFTGYVLVVARERVRPNDYVAMGLVFAAVAVSMAGRK
jgi:hypothetical protein